MKKKIIIVMALLLTQTICAFGQNIPLLNVPSPEVAGLGTYGTIPVGLYTGMPDISVPLHEMRAGGQSFPLVASYHLASVKPQMQEGCLGIGWNLQAGGYISRSVNGIYDEKMHTDGYAPGFYANAHRLKGMSTDRFENACLDIVASDGSNSYYELSADEFSFSFFGHSGTFYYNEDGGWTVISDEDIRVEFNPADGEGFIGLKGLRPEIKPGSWGASNTNNRFFNKFTLITPDGCRYEFGGINATEYSIPYYTRYNSDFIATTWQLSRIVTPENRTITYTYEAKDLICDLKYVPQSKTVTGLPCTASNPSRGRDAMTGFLILPVRLASIETPDETISFSYFYDLAYGGRFWKNALGWIKGKYQAQSIYHPFETLNYFQFASFISRSIDTESDLTVQNSIQASLTHSTLHRISVQSKYSKTHARSIYFDYVFNNRRKLSRIAWREGIPALIPDYAQASGVMYLRGYKIPESTEPDKDMEYDFAYNTTNPMPDNYVSPETDDWGYYVGSNVSFAAIPVFTKPAPSLVYSQSDVLTEITYPTGGKTRFEYELNSYSKVVDVTHTRVENHSGKAGGLRVSAVSRYDDNGALLDTKKYYYAESRNAGSASSGILREAPAHEIIYTAPKGITLRQKSQGGYFASVTNLNSPVVGYSYVIEETLDAAGNSQGYIRHSFSNYDTDIFGNTHFDEPALYSNSSGESAVKPFTSRSLERGKLLSEEYYNSAGRLVKKREQRYKEVNPGSFKSAHQAVVYFCTDIDFVSYDCVGTLTRVYTHSYLPCSMDEKEYPSDGSGTSFSTQRMLTYNTHRLLKEESILTSKGDKRTIRYTYPADQSGYQWMVNANMLSPIVEKTTSEGGKSVKEIWAYDHWYTGTKYIPHVKSITREFNPLSSRTVYEVQATDRYSNPVEFVSKGVTNICIWSYEGKRLIARIENASYDKVESLLGKSPQSFSEASRPDNATYNLIAGIRHKLPKAQVYIYKYTPGLQVESVTSPNGQTVFYKYDYMDRLREEYFHEKTAAGLLQKKILNLHDYHYQHESTNIIK